MKQYIAITILLVFYTLQSSANSCLAVFAVEQPVVERSVLASYQKVQNYIKAAEERIIERDYVLKTAVIALIAQEGTLLMGPPGTAKSLVADTLFKDIVSEKDKKNSYFRIQMTPETTFSETHGPIDILKLQNEGKQERRLEEGMLMSRNVFIDEIFDARANALRNLLGALAERAHAQGRHIVKGAIESFFAATNKYISEVYERSGDDGPKAVLDRFAFNIFIPKMLEKSSSTNQIIKSSGLDHPPMPLLTFEDLAVLRQLVKKVEIPDHVADFLSILRREFMLVTESVEQASLVAHEESLRNGEAADPPYRATKYLSDRTVYKSAKILKTLVVLRHLQSGGKEPLEANFSDVKDLESFFTLSGPRDAFLKSLLQVSGNPHEKRQIETILFERETFRKTYDKILNEINESIASYGVSEIQAKDMNLLSGSEKEELSIKLASKLVVLKKEVEAIEDNQLTRKPSDMSKVLVKEYIETTLLELLGEVKYNEVVLASEKAFEKRIQEEERIQLEKIEKERQEREKAIAQAEAEARRSESLKAKVEGVKELDNLEVGPEFSNKTYFNTVEASGERYAILLNPNKIVKVEDNGKLVDIFREGQVNADLKAALENAGQIFFENGHFVMTINDKFIKFNPKDLTQVEEFGTYSLIGDHRIGEFLEKDQYLAIDKENKVLSVMELTGKKIQSVSLESVNTTTGHGTAFKYFADSTEKSWFYLHSYDAENFVFLKTESGRDQMVSFVVNRSTGESYTNLLKGEPSSKIFPVESSDKNYIYALSWRANGVLDFFKKEAKTEAEMETVKVLEDVDLVSNLKKYQGKVENVQFFDSGSIISILTEKGLVLVDIVKQKIILEKDFDRSGIFDLRRIADGEYLMLSNNRNLELSTLKVPEEKEDIEEKENDQAQSGIRSF